MTAIHWLTATNGSFTNAADWSGGLVPGASDDAILDAVGPSFTVTSGVNETVESLQLASNATLSLTSGTFTAKDGTGSGANAGVILVGAGAVFATSEAFVNTGSIMLGAAGKRSEMLIEADMTLTGGGLVDLGQKGEIAIYGSNKMVGTGFYNLDNTIIGSGTIARAPHAKLLGEIINGPSGIIEANESAPLDLYVSVVNHGLIEAQDGGSIRFSMQRYMVNDGGTILAGAESAITLSGLVHGGSIASVGTGVILVGNGTSLYNLSNSANIYAGDGGGIALVQAIHNTGTISLNADKYRCNMVIEHAVTLTGDGTIALGSSAKNMIIISNYGPFSNVDNTISGGGFIGYYGNIGQNNVSLVNGAAGVIDAGSVATLTINTLTDAITNAGLIEATGAGGCIIDSAVDNTGTLSANGGVLTVNAAVTGSGVATINAGTLDFQSGFNEAVTFTGKTGTLALARSQKFTNSVKGFSQEGKTTLDLGDIRFIDADEATFSGTASGGVLTVTDGSHTANITLKGNYLASSFIASNDGHGGTDVIARKSKDLAAPLQAFISAMAGIGAVGGNAVHAGNWEPTREFLLTSPRVAIA